MEHIKKTLEKLMKKNGVKHIVLNDHCGRVLFDGKALSYDHKYSCKYYTANKYAYEAALKQLENDMPLITEYNDNCGKVFESTIYLHDFDSHYPDRTAKNKWFWESDIKDSGVMLTFNEDNECVFSGDIDTLRKFKSFACNHCRYTRSTYIYSNEEVEKYLSLCGRYGLFKPHDSFDEYYHNTIVD